MKRLILVSALLVAAVSGGASVRAMPQSNQTAPSSHVAWVADALSRLQTIKPGMRRADLLKVVTTEGGIFSPLQRTFVSRDCPYFKVDVKFRAIGRPERDQNGRQTPESSEDVVVEVSRPYLQFSVVD